MIQREESLIPVFLDMSGILSPIASQKKHYGNEANQVAQPLPTRGGRVFTEPILRSPEAPRGSGERVDSPVGRSVYETLPD
jgi:hypothetical protein